jgi:outer membrane cobalamin receptor
MDTKSVELFSELDWQPTDNDNINANITIESTALDSNDKEAPYSIPFRLGLNYRRSWLDNFGTQIGLNYIGKRFADIDNKEELPGYLDLGLRADYSMSDALTVYGKLSNLLNSEVYIWQGYKERGLFVSAGILWKF